MSWELLLIKILGAAFVAAVFAGIVFLLRFLYGPKGRLRKPEWDVWNEEARRELVCAENRKAEASLREAFSAYAKSFFTGVEEDDAPLQLKLEHTFEVVRHAEEIAGREPDFADEETAHALRLAALFHDVGRFDQFRRYRTFFDGTSCNHALLGVAILRERKFLRKEARKTRALVLAAVAAHNRFTVSAALPAPLRQVLLGLRDADKLDILRVMADNLRPGGERNGVVLLHLQDEPGSYSPAVLQALDEKRTALYRDMRYVNDFRILLCSWVHDLHFFSSYRIIRREGYFNRIVDGMDALPELQQRLRACVESALLSAGAAAGQPDGQN